MHNREKDQNAEPCLDKSVQEPQGGLSIRTDLRAGTSIEEIQGQVSSWWQNVASSLSLPGADSSATD